MQKPRFKPHFHVQAIAPQHVFLIDETRNYVLEGKAYHAIAPLLDGQRTTEEIVETLADAVPTPELIFALHTLKKRGYLVEAWPEMPVEQAAFWSRLDVDPAAARARLQDTGVTVRAIGGVDAAPVEGALRAMGISGGDGLAVLVTDDYAHDTIADFNSDSTAAGRTWMLAKPVGTTVWIGPRFVPGETACWRCLVDVLVRNRHAEHYVETVTGRRVVSPAATISASIGVASNLIATEVARIVAGAPGTSYDNRILTFDLLTLETATHHVRRRPHCPACGTAPAATAPPPLRLESRKKRFTADGGHRAFTPEETWSRLSTLVSPISGVVTSLLRKEQTENGLTFSYATGHDFAVVSDDLSSIRQNMRFRSGGKGMSDLQARVSGVSEAIERYSGVWRGTEFTVRGSRRALGSRAIDLNDVMLFSDAQFANRREWNATCSPTHYHVVPEPLGPDHEIDWSPFWDLTSGCEVLVPSAFCYYGHPETRQFFCGTDANGTAVGNTLEEAILQGLLELVERDAIAVWWYNRIPRPAIDLDSFNLPYVRSLQRHYASLGRELWVLDLTHDLGVPVFAGVSRRINAPTEDLIVSFGAHLDPVVALTRALTETNQFLPALSRIKPDGTTIYAYEDPDAISWWKTATVANQPYVAPAAPAMRSRQDFAAQATHDLREDVEQVTRRLADKGLHVLVLDQTRADIGFPVVKVLAPGLRHFWRRLAPGRVYDVPVSLGWLKRPLSECDMNPISMFF
jgi:ribosomal protein S12 methylthiotransferase accessory factor